MGGAKRKSGRGGGWESGNSLRDVEGRRGSSGGVEQRREGSDVVWREGRKMRKEGGKIMELLFLEGGMAGGD